MPLDKALDIRRNRIKFYLAPASLVCIELFALWLPESYY
uniref:Uncharacterized protein n=1 Tax=Pseudomonas aeruginosa TaxID=287 RepID=A0A2L1KF85_PSEAI|nr:Hypothetical protein [Pseudomonas aeruginosa]